MEKRERKEKGMKWKISSEWSMGIEDSIGKMI